MTKLVCVKCQTEYSSKLGEIGVIVVEMAHNPPVPYKAWGADLLKCPGCGAEVISGFADRPITRDEEAAAVLLADAQRIGKARIIYDYERPVTPAPADPAQAHAEALEMELRYWFHDVEKCSCGECLDCEHQITTWRLLAKLDAKRKAQKGNTP